MKVSFYGTRGSCPTPGPNTLKYGGNTACVLIESDDGKHKLILDSGTGIRILGDELFPDHDELYLLLSHNHYDHIQGFPFFKPAYQKNRKINIYPAVTTPDQPYAITEQMNDSYFPVEPALLAADIQFQFPNWSQPVEINGFKVSRHTINHPNGGMGYVIEHNNQRVAYVTDNELKAIDGQVKTSDIAAFVQGVDLLIHDGQYVEADLPLKQGWGHSLISDSIDFAQQAGVKTLVIYSHDPERTDQELDDWQAKINQMKLTCNVILSQEGQTLHL
ncbi:MAG: MBL fold metallo-hydrolase [Thalassotalea sp.]